MPSPRYNTVGTGCNTGFVRYLRDRWSPHSSESLYEARPSLRDLNNYSQFPSAESAGLLSVASPGLRFSLASFQHLADTIERPIDLVARDSQGRGDADHAIVSFLAQYALILERFAVGPRGGVQLDSDP